MSLRVAVAHLGGYGIFQSILVIHFCSTPLRIRRLILVRRDGGQIDPAES